MGRELVGGPRVVVFGDCGGGGTGGERVGVARCAVDFVICKTQEFRLEGYNF